MQAGRPVPTLTPAMIAIWLALATVPLWIERVGLYQYLGVEILIFATYAMAYNLVLGHSGLPSFGHGAFFGLGAYGFGLAQLNLVADLWFCLGAAVVVASTGGAIVAAFISHRRGIYYSLLTIAFGQVFWFIAIKSHAITGGEDGLLKIARLPIRLGVATIDLTGNVSLFYFVLAVFVAVTLLLWRLVHSPFGRVLKAIKQNETRARFVGYEVWRYKAAVLVLSAGLSGLAGGLFAMAQASAFPDVMSLHYSGYVVMMTLVGGGLVTFWGPLLGALVFLLARDVIGAFTTGWMLWFGLLFVALVMYKPEGLGGLFLATRPGARQGKIAMALFEAHELHLRFGDRVVLEHISLSFEAGRLSGIMGPNGAGKTTCFNVLTGRYRPDRGACCSTAPTSLDARHRQLRGWALHARSSS